MQESLTNVLKHSGARQARSASTYGDDGVDVEVRDAGHGGRARAGVGSAPAATDSSGLRERTRLLGGALDVRRGRRRRVHGCAPTCPSSQGGGVVIRVAVVDDQELVRSGFVVLLGSSPDIEVVGEAGDGAEAWELCRRTAPDVVLMDVRMPRMDGWRRRGGSWPTPVCRRRTCSS